MTEDLAGAVSPPPVRRPRSRAGVLPSLVGGGLGGLVVDTGSTDSFTVYAASQIGDQHVDDGQPREDAYVIGSSGTSVIVSVADGLSSTRNAHVAADLLARGVTDVLHDRFAAGDSAPPWTTATDWDTESRNAVAAVTDGFDADAVDRRAFERLYLSRGPTAGLKSTQSGAATLAFVVAESTSRPARAFWGVVGDTEIAHLDIATSEWTWTSASTFAPTNQPSNLVEALPQDLDTLRSGVVEFGHDSVIVVATDGIARALHNEPDWFAQRVAAAVDQCPSMASFAQILDFHMGGLYDDRSIACLWTRR